MPLGALPVIAMLREGVDAAKKRVDEILDASLPPLLTDPVFYAIGGGWRALARVHLATTGAPISVVHGYEVAAAEIAGPRQADLAHGARGGRGPPRRAGAPGRHAAGGRARPPPVLKKLQPERVVFSMLGLREGWLYAQLDDEEQYRDPLLEGAQAIGLPAARVPEFSAALARWTDDLFPGETQADRRLRLAVCALTDLAWRDHEKVRAQESFRRLLQFPFIGISHAERAFLAVAIMARYGGSVDDAVRAATQGPAGPEPAPPRRDPRPGAAPRPPLLGQRAGDPRPRPHPDRHERGPARGAEPPRMSPTATRCRPASASSPGSAASRGPRSSRPRPRSRGSGLLQQPLGRSASRMRSPP